MEIKNVKFQRLNPRTGKYEDLNAAPDGVTIIRPTDELMVDSTEHHLAEAKHFFQNNRKERRRQRAQDRKSK